jgi:hypothetical protein
MLHVWDVLLAMVRCAIGDEHRSVATARRQFFDLTGFMPEESSFYDRLTPAFADLAWQMFLRVLASANRVQRRRVAKALGVHVRDVHVVDASVVTLPARAAAHLPSTDSKHGGFKITATLSVLEDLMVPHGAARCCAAAIPASSTSSRPARTPSRVGWTT